MTLVNPDLYRDLGITDFEYYLYMKNTNLEDKPLRRTYRKMKCRVCSSGNEVHGHHIFNCGKFRLDRDYNLEPLCNKCHMKLHHHASQFIREHGAELYNELTNWEPVMQKFLSKIQEEI